MYIFLGRSIYVFKNLIIQRIHALTRMVVQPPTRREGSEFAPENPKWEYREREREICFERMEGINRNDFLGSWVGALSLLHVFYQFASQVKGNKE